MTNLQCSPGLTAGSHRGHRKPVPQIGAAEAPKDARGASCCWKHRYVLTKTCVSMGFSSGLVGFYSRLMGFKPTVMDKNGELNGIYLLVMTKSLRT